MKLTEYFKKRTVIQTERLLFRRIKVSDASDMYEYSCRPETSRFLLWSPHPYYSYTVELMHQLQREYAAGRYHDFAVVLKDSMKMIGTAGFTRYDAESGVAELGYVINPDYHGRGIATEALGVIMDFAFRYLDANRVECRYLDGNAPSLRVMQKCGMKWEGIRGRLYVKGDYRDFGVCSISKDEYFARKNTVKYEISEKKTLLSRLFHKN